MCGICGIAGARGSRSHIESTLVAMRETMVARGPDDAGAHVDEGIALGVRRLAIVDLSERGHMPMWDASGRFCIVHNGEVFNFRELAAELRGRGVRLRSATDTEVILELFARQGPATLPRLNGFFAFAIWDSQRNSLFIARDRVGIKPLYYAGHDGALLFASEIKALFAAGLPKRFDEECWEELLCYRFTAGERTPLAGVKRLLPGHWLRWEEGRLTTGRWWNLVDRVHALERSTPIGAEWFRQTFDSAVGLRRISDVPVGLLLSGGLDSSAVAVSLAQQTQEHLATFTVRFAEDGYDESALAREVADRSELKYHDLTVAPSSLLSHLRTASVLRDEPLAHVNEVHLWLLSAMAKPLVTVLLSGEGADEVMGGYVRYQPLRFLSDLFGARATLARLGSLPVSRRVRKLVRFLELPAEDDLVLFNACDVLPDELHVLGMVPRDQFGYRRAVLEEARALYADEPVRQAMFLDQHTFLCSLLDRNDRMTMGASIECRVPFLDYRLVEGLAAAPSELLFSGFRGKALLRRSMEGRLPRSVLSHRKWGFGVPWNQYLRQVPELRRFVGMLPAMEPIRNGPFARQRVRATVDAFLRGDESVAQIILQLVMIAVWFDAYVCD